MQFKMILSIPQRYFRYSQLQWMHLHCSLPSTCLLVHGGGETLPAEGFRTESLHPRHTGTTSKLQGFRAKQQIIYQHFGHVWTTTA
jgi:hypothetical protein